MSGTCIFRFAKSDDDASFPGRDARAETDQVVLRATCLTPTQRPAAQVRTAASTAQPIAGSLNVPANSARSASTM